jgi:hypothetical protein
MDRLPELRAVRPRDLTSLRTVFFCPIDGRLAATGGGIDHFVITARQSPAVTA